MENKGKWMSRFNAAENMRLLEKLENVTREAERWILDVIGENESIEILEEDLDLFYVDYSHIVVMDSDDIKGEIAGVANIDGRLYVKLLLDKEWLYVSGYSEVIYEIMLFIDDVNEFLKRKEDNHDEQ